jgi:hypothetical protein
MSTRLSRARVNSLPRQTVFRRKSGFSFGNIFYLRHFGYLFVLSIYRNTVPYMASK